MDPVKARVVESEEKFFELHGSDEDTRGMVCFTNYKGVERILCECPCGCGSCMHLPVYPQGEPHPSITAWSLSENREMPSLDPSIRDMNGCRFHGFLKVGLWTFCSDSGVK